MSRMRLAGGLMLVVGLLDGLASLWWWALLDMEGHVAVASFVTSLGLSWIGVFILVIKADI